MNTAECAYRNEKIVAARAAGQLTSAVARRFGVTDRQCRRILAEHRATASEAITDPMTILERTLAEYDAEIERLTEISKTSCSPQVRLRAINTKLRTISEKTTLRSVSTTPARGSFWPERDALKLTESVLRVFKKYGLPKEAQEELMAAAAAARKPA